MITKPSSLMGFIGKLHAHYDWSDSMIIGIDGGGTKTKVMLTDGNLKVLSSATSGPSSIRTVPIETSIANIKEAIEACLKDFPDIRIQSVFAGLGDVTGEEDGQLVAEKLRNIHLINKAIITVKNDVFNAHAGALEGAAGIAIIIGTGSVAFGVDERGHSHRAGGYSYKEGDFGSAYGLGKQALSMVGKAMDGRAMHTPMTEALMSHLGIASFMDAVQVYDTYHTQRTEVAALAKFVTKHAEQGDANAIQIIDYATDELLLMIRAVNQCLQLKNKAVGIIGSLGNADTLLKREFVRKLIAYDASFAVFGAKQDPVFGSCVLAKQQLKHG